MAGQSSRASISGSLATVRPARIAALTGSHWHRDRAATRRDLSQHGALDQRHRRHFRSRAPRLARRVAAHRQAPTCRSRSPTHSVSPRPPRHRSRHRRSSDHARRGLAQGRRRRYADNLPPAARPDRASHTCSPTDACRSWPRTGATRCRRSRARRRWRSRCRPCRRIATTTSSNRATSPDRAPRLVQSMALLSTRSWRDAFFSANSICNSSAPWTARTGLPFLSYHRSLNCSCASASQVGHASA